jgi:hypothetical protein
MLLTANPGLTLTALSAPANSTDDDALRLLASWAATRRSDTVETPGNRADAGSPLTPEPSP